MFRDISVDPLKSRLGRELYLIAALIAVIPVGIVAALSMWQIERSYDERTRDQLDQAARQYGQNVFERLLTASELLEKYTQLNDTGQANRNVYFDGIAWIDERGHVTGDIALSDDIIRRAKTVARPALIPYAGDSNSFYLLQNAGERTGVALLSAGFLWGDPSIFPYATDYCVFSESAAAPLFCSDESLEHLRSEVFGSSATHGNFRWDGESGHHFSSYWELFLASSFDSSLLRIVATTPQSVAFADLANFRNLYIPALLSTIVCALLASGMYARRNLQPLAELLKISRSFASRDFSARADLKRRDEFNDLAQGLHHMAHELSQHFKARETLSEIDHVILSGAEITETVNLVLDRLMAALPCHCASVTLFSDESWPLATRSTLFKGNRAVRIEDTEEAEQIRDWIAAHPEGALVEGEESRRLFPGAEDAALYVLPLVVRERPWGVLSVSGLAEAFEDELHQSHLRDLCGRLAVAVESIKRGEELHRKAYFDELTGLPNRDFCFERLDQAIKQADHFETAVAVMFIDLDGFKGINDAMGHIAGDELIRQAAYRLSACVGELGTIGRLGGDEFALVLPFPVNYARPEFMAEKLLAELCEPFQIGSSEIHLSASIGIARYPDDGENRVELLRKADTAMYQAKEAGRGQSANYSQTMGIKVDKRMMLEAELRHALEREEMEIHYQPQVDMLTGRIASAEALMRWRHSEKGYISPAEFVPVAEDSGYINVLGAWILARAAEQLVQWRADGFDLQRIAVNVSAAQFRRKDFGDEVEDVLRRFSISPGSLELELTESVFVDDLSQARGKLDALKRAGVVISIDDFGTGYSSLGYLKHLTFDLVKVDRSFISGLPIDRESAAIVNAVLAMCHTMGKKVVAEGIEVQSQYDYLRRANVDIGQGYLIGKPMPAAEFAEFLASCEDNAVVSIGK